MIPQLDELNIGEEIEEKEFADRTYCIDRENKKIAGLIDGYEAAKQALYFILSTERYKYEIYDPDYGLYIKDLIGQPINYVYSELKRRISEAILWDSRFTYVEDFDFRKGEKRDSFVLAFKVGSIYGEEIESLYKFTQEGGEVIV